MDPLSIIASIGLLRGVTSRIYKQFEELKNCDKVFSELQHEIGSLRHVLEDITVNLESSEAVVGNREESEEKYRDQVRRALSGATDVLRRMDAWSNVILDVRSLGMTKIEAEGWQRRIQMLRKQLMRLPPDSQLDDVVVKFNPRSFHLARKDVCHNVDDGPLKCTFGCKLPIKSKHDWRRHEERHEETLDHRILPFVRKKIISEGGSAQVYKIAIGVTSVATSAMSAICMLNYDILRNYPRRGPVFASLLPDAPSHSIPLTQLYPAIFRPGVTLPPFISDPSPTVFVVATFVNGLTTFAYYASRKTDRYREWFLGVGAMAAIGSGAIVGVNIQVVLLSFMPLALITSLVSCTALNYLWDHCKRGRERNAIGVLDIADEKKEMEKLDALDAC
ncbi:hypothetical protein K469DRAFT_744316 [Zopfia rhizophila CBS 207.26]|uniref:Fungal N-terminal domain-containing protein n=1 Tax=Zopfia rhizophila CBS 207.26 TaxID=1314779 RepID=A0A6A6EXE2_9PEZI|nr:hypothetical protein K469DRAFT_744316 [Zopfia rhizophila CBS 207.26]